MDNFVAQFGCAAIPALLQCALFAILLLLNQTMLLCWAVANFPSELSSICVAGRVERGSCYCDCTCDDWLRRLVSFTRCQLSSILREPFTTSSSLGSCSLEQAALPACILPLPEAAAKFIQPLLAWGSFELFAALILPVRDVDAFIWFILLFLSEFY